MNSSGIALEGLGCPSSLSDMMSWPLEGCTVGQGWTEYPDISFTLYASIASMGAQMPIKMKFLNIISITVLVLYYYKTKTTHTQLDFNTLSITLYHTGRSDSVVSKWTFQATCSVQLWTFLKPNVQNQCMHKTSTVQLLRVGVSISGWLCCSSPICSRDAAETFCLRLRNKVVFRLSLRRCQTGGCCCCSHEWS